ncbi:MAG: sulfatase-like hydrolase/transferase [Acidobacteria bacterium]|nr:sulfatase-like hydrolase/transferase [Acidobacteriota bacterium]
MRSLALLLLSVGLAASAPAQAPARPNVILILADDVGQECFGFSGSKQYSTPNLDRLADSGVRFTRAYSTPLCTPSRVNLMTGKSNVRNYVDFGALKPGERTFAHLFREAGYATAIAGKWQLQGSKNAAGTAPADAGFDSYCLWNTARTQRPRYWTPSIEQDGELLDLPADAYGPDVFSSFLIRFMESHRDEPFFLYYPMALVHDPFLPTPDSADRHSTDAQRNFEDMVAYMDKIVGRIDAALGRLNLRDNTVLIFTADNGTNKKIVSRLGDRQIRGEKGQPTEAGTHVPLVVHAPGLVPGGRVLDELIDFSDHLPTMAEVIGAPPQKGVDGRSYWPLLRGDPSYQPRPWIYTWYFPRPYTAKPDADYNHAEVRWAQDGHYQLFGDGRLVDLLSGRPATEHREALQKALDSMPSKNPNTP